MSERISLAEMRRRTRHADEAHPDFYCVVLGDDELDALVEAVEAARHLVRPPFGQLTMRDFYGLREKLHRFDFSEVPA